MGEFNSLMSCELIIYFGIFGQAARTTQSEVKPKCTVFCFFAMHLIEDTDKASDIGTTSLNLAPTLALL